MASEPGLEVTLPTLVDVCIELSYQLVGSRSYLREHPRPSLELKALYDSWGLLPDISKVYGALHQQPSYIVAIDVVIL